MECVLVALLVDAMVPLKVLMMVALLVDYLVDLKVA